MGALSSRMLSSDSIPPAGTDTGCTYKKKHLTSTTNISASSSFSTLTPGSLFLTTEPTKPRLMFTELAVTDKDRKRKRSCSLGMLFCCIGRGGKPNGLKSTSIGKIDISWPTKCYHTHGLDPTNIFALHIQNAAGSYPYPYPFPLPYAPSDPDLVASSMTNMGPSQIRPQELPIYRDFCRDDHRRTFSPEVMRMQAIREPFGVLTDRDLYEGERTDKVGEWNVTHLMVRVPEDGQGEQLQAREDEEDRKSGRSDTMRPITRHGKP